MADLNSTIVRGNLRVTEDINTNGNISTNSLVTSVIESQSANLYINVSNNGIKNAASFGYSNPGGAILSFDGHLKINDGGSYSGKPTNQTTWDSVTYADYSNTGISVFVSNASSQATCNLSFPGKTGTFLLDSDLVAEDRAEVTFLPSDKTYSSVLDNGQTDSLNSILTVTSTSINGSVNAGDRIDIKAFTGSLGGDEQPVYIANGGHLRACTKQYAGGTNLSANGTNYGGNSVSIYAPKYAISSSTAKRYLLGSSLTNNIETTNTNEYCYMESNSVYAQYFYGTSDRRLKENIKDLDLNCLDLVNNINLREFSWKADEMHKPVIGAIAQELKQILPEKYVHEFIGGQETKDEYLSINDSKLVYLLIGAIQEQQKEIENLKAKIDGKIV